MKGNGEAELYAVQKECRHVSVLCRRYRAMVIMIVIDRFGKYLSRASSDFPGMQAQHQPTGSKSWTTKATPTMASARGARSNEPPESIDCPKRQTLRGCDLAKHIAKAQVYTFGTYCLFRKPGYSGPSQEVRGFSMGRHEPLRAGDFETIADGAAAVKARSDSSSGSSSSPFSSAPSDQMTVAFGP